MNKSVKRISLDFLVSNDACRSGVDYWQNNGRPKTIKKCIEICINDASGESFNYANWLITKCFTKKQCVQYAVFSAEQVIDFFESKYPNDDRPRKAIEAARFYIENPDADAAKAAAAARAAARDAAAAAAWAAAKAAARDAAAAWAAAAA